MTPPDYKTCTEKELWQYIAWHLEDAGIRPVLVGGAVVSIYSEGLYQSGDLDLVLDRHDRTGMEAVLEGLGFLPDKSRYYKHPDCTHLYLEFPKGPVELGEEYPVIPDEVPFEGKTLRILSPTDCVKDRLAGYIHWNARAGFNQALLICRRQQPRVDLDQVAAWCQHEGPAGVRAFAELSGRLAESEVPEFLSP